MNRFKLLYTTLVFFFTVNVFLFAQGDPSELKEGYFTSPKLSTKGLILTDDFESSLYLVKDGKYERLMSAPGCGRFYTISPDGNFIGFKLIDHESGLQTPALFNLTNKNIIKLTDPVEIAGQVTFTNDGSICYTVGTKLYVKGKELKSYELGVYSNWTPISPDRKFVVFKDDNDQLWKYNLESDTKEELTDHKNGYCNVQISPDSKNLVFNSIDAKVFTYNFNNKEQKYVDEGEEPQWSPNGSKITYYKRTIDFDNFKTTNSDVFEYDVKLNVLKNISNTEDILEINSTYTNDGNILYNNFTTSEIQKIAVNSLQKGVSNTIFKQETELEPVIFYNENKNRLAKANSDLDRWEHIHQVFDTRQYGTWTNFPGGKHQGYRCCGATSAMEILASYKILPKWPMTTYNHTSNYGKYISDEFTFGDFTFKNFSYGSTIGFRTGMHGYMWSNGSPSSRTVGFMKIFGVSSKRSDYPSWSKIKAELELGYPYILCSTALTSGHIVVGIGQYGPGHTLYCNDPYGDKNAGSYGNIRNGKNAIYDWADANTGHQKISPVVWGVTARFTPDLHLLESYPENENADLACNANIILVFDAPIDSASVKGNVILTDAFENEIETSVDPSGFKYKKIILVPTKELDYNTNYKVILKKELKDVYSAEMVNDTTLTFKTMESTSVVGVDVDQFEAEGRYELFTSGAENKDSALSYTSDENIVGENSGKLKYSFTSSSNGYYRIMDKEEFYLGANADSSFGIWVSGDANRHKLELWFSYDNGQLVSGYSEAITWSGWKFISVELSKIKDGTSIKFNSIAIRQNSSAPKDGEIYFDGAVKFKTGEVITDIIDNNSQLPVQFELKQNYPNPFNPSTIIEFNIPVVGTLHATSVRVNIYDVLGRQVKTLINKELSGGKYKLTFDASGLPSGVYIYRLEAQHENGFYNDTKKMLLLK